MVRTTYLNNNKKKHHPDKRGSRSTMHGLPQSPFLQIVGISSFVFLHGVCPTKLQSHRGSVHSGPLEYSFKKQQQV